MDAELKGLFKWVFIVLVACVAFAIVVVEITIMLFK